MAEWVTTNCDSTAYYKIHTNRTCQSLNFLHKLVSRTFLFQQVLLNFLQLSIFRLSIFRSLEIHDGLFVLLRHWKVFGHALSVKQIWSLESSIFDFSELHFHTLDFQDVRSFLTLVMAFCWNFFVVLDFRDERRLDYRFLKFEPRLAFDVMRHNFRGHTENWVFYI